MKSQNQKVRAVKEVMEEVHEMIGAIGFEHNFVSNVLYVTPFICALTLYVYLISFVVCCPATKLHYS